ncbi:hypothetical protein PDG61_09570 [Mycolicibacterium sp. BiH015]|uniref:hypothetical protein n=1 Tax=Mycolicibacterium sp. BiH015 TaxID=3018808 RepID=UPI0022E26274|nr:hypothetical protein [Mycolicibacterium sp. BiH015]MDA2891161.1 hypothetical protein [Mycolicibacterium sp. BiH015]
MFAGVVCATDLGGRVAAHDRVLERSEPFAFAAQNLYAALSEADAAAASAFLSGGIQTPTMRDRYRRAIAAATAALTDVTAGATDAQMRDAAAIITAQLATYTGLVEAARANNIQGFPVGSAYQREASTLMQTELLPGAQRILAHDLDAVERDRRAVGSPGWPSIVMLGGVLCLIAISSWILLRRTNRRFNIGLILAVVLAALAAVWIVAVTRLSAAELETSRSEGTIRIEQLARARILAQQTRTVEILQLIDRGDITSSETDFQTRIDELQRTLDDGPQATLEGIDRWRASHGKHVVAYTSGDYLGAVAIAIGPDPAASAAQFGTVEDSLAEEIQRTRAVLREHVAAAGGYLAWSPAGVLVLLGLAGTAAIVGLWPRLKEFL